MDEGSAPRQGAGENTSFHSGSRPRGRHGLLLEGEVAKVLSLACCEALAGSLRRRRLRGVVSKGCSACCRACSFLVSGEEPGRARRSVLKRLRSASMGVHEGVRRAMSGAKLSECRSPGEARQRSSVPKLRKCQRLFIEKGEPAEAVAARCGR